MIYIGIEKIVNKYKKKESQPAEVWANTEMDELRREECLCRNCDRKNDVPPWSSCHVSAKLFGIAEKYSMAMAITRCGAVDKKGELMYKPLK